MPKSWCGLTQEPALHTLLLSLSGQSLLILKRKHNIMWICIIFYNRISENGHYAHPFTGPQNKNPNTLPVFSPKLSNCHSEVFNFTIWKQEMPLIQPAPLNPRGLYRTYFWEIPRGTSGIGTIAKARILQGLMSGRMAFENERSMEGILLMEEILQLIGRLW